MAQPTLRCEVCKERFGYHEQFQGKISSYYIEPEAYRQVCIGCVINIAHEYMKSNPDMFQDD